MAIEYKCPNCGSTRLKVDCTVTLDFRQFEFGDPILESPSREQVSKAHWDNESTVYCKDCESWGSLLDARIDT